jgi:leader peptidase (prepilin peptidase) / N-methyltransferase
MSEFMFYRIASFIFGAMFGSFANVCIHRIPLEQSVVNPGSRCPFCKTKISFYDNIPILSYIILRARCRHCGVYISPRYFVVELLTAISALALFAKYGLGPEFFIYFFFVLSVIIISGIDLEHRIIPNVISLPGIVIGILLSWLLSYTGIPWENDLVGSLIGIAVGGGALWGVGYLYSVLTGREGIGLGDVKLLAMFGAFFGWKGAFFSIFVGSILGGLVGVPLALIKGRSLKYPIPFGPFLVAGLISYLWFARDLLENLISR